MYFLYDHLHYTLLATPLLLYCIMHCTWIGKRNISFICLHARIAILRSPKYSTYFSGFIFIVWWYLKQNTNRNLMAFLPGPSPFVWFESVAVLLLNKSLATNLGSHVIMAHNHGEKITLWHLITLLLQKWTFCLSVF